MKFRLQKIKYLRSPTTGTPGESVVKDHPSIKDKAIFRYRFTRIVAEITSVTGKKCETDMCSILEHLLETLYGTRRTKEVFHEEFWTMDIGVGVASEPIPGNAGQVPSYVLVKGVHPEKNILGALRDFTDHEARIKLHYKLKERTGNTTLWEFLTADMRINRDTQATCDDHTLKFPLSLLQTWEETPGMYAKFTITVTIPDEALPGNYKRHTNPSEVGCQRILEEEILSDVSIITSDGSRVKAHKNFLAAQSTVFLAMFQSNMKESRESTIEISDMSGESVRAFLKYVYYGDIHAAEENSQMVFELLYAGHKYDISGLENMMKGWILEKSNDWFDVDVGVRLFVFARNRTPEDEELKRKAIQVLKCNYATLENCASVQELFKKDSKAALELLKYSFST